MKNQDIQLINRTLKGDDSAFSELVKKYQKQVHALAWRKVSDFHIAEDITQDTFLKAYQKLHTLKEPHQFAGWLYVIAARECLAWYRNKRLQKKTLEKVDTTPTNKDVYSQHISEEKAKTAEMETREVVKQILETLKESERTVITLHYFGEMTCEEISKFLGVSANTIKSRLRRARNRLKKEEAMIREAISNFQISPTITADIMQEIARTKPITPSASKPLMPWVIGLSSAVLIALMLGIGSQYLARFQEPYSLDSQVEMEVELVEAPIVKEIEKVNDERNQSGQLAEFEGRGNGDGDNANQVSEEKGDYTKWNLPEGAKRRLGKGIINDMQFSPDGTRLTIASNAGVWLYDVSTGDEIAILIGDRQKTQNTNPRVLFSPDSKKIATSGYDKKIRIWDATVGKSILSIDIPKSPTKLFKILSDGTWSTHILPLNQEVFTVGDFLVEDKPGSLTTISDGSLKSLKFLPDSKTLMIQNMMATIWLWDITTGREIDSFSPKLPEPKYDEYIDWVVDNPDRWQSATDVYIDPSGKVMYALAAGDRYGTIYIQDGHTHKLIRTLDGKRTVEDNPDTVERTDDGESVSIQDRLRIPGVKTLFSSEQHPSWIEWIDEIYFAPDGKTLTTKSRYFTSKSTGQGGASELWDVDTGKLIAKFDWGIDVKFSGNGKTLAFLSRRMGGGCAIWDLTERQEIATFSASFSETVDVKFSRDNRYFIITGDDFFEIWDIAKRSQINVLNTVPGQYSFLQELHAFSEDGKILAAVDRYGTINLWEALIDTQMHTLTTDYTTRITTLAFAHDGKTLASGDRSGNIQLWDLTTNKTNMTFTSSKKGYIGGLTFSKNNTKLISESMGTIEEWDVTTGKKGNSYTIPEVNHNVEGTDYYWSASGNYYFRWSIGKIALTPEGGKLAGRLKDGHIRSKIGVWDIATGNKVFTITDESYVRPLALSSDEKMLATLGEDKKDIIYLWDISTGKQLAAFDVTKDSVPVGETSVFAGVISHDGKMLAAAGSFGNNAIFLWDIQTQTHIATLRGHANTVCRLTISPDDTILASGDESGDIHLWEIPNGKQIVKFESPGGYISNLTFAPDGKTLASTNGYPEGGIIFLWDIPSK